MPATPVAPVNVSPTAARRRRVEHGDWQTPLPLAEAVMDIVRRVEPGAQAVLEPTCGTGTFLAAAGRAFAAARLFGFELSPAYAASARDAVAGRDAVIRVADFFQTSWNDVLAKLPEPLVVVGNPPWVTSSTLGALSANNLPAKSNFKGHAGFDALTGKGNFDISEWMILRLLEAARGRRFSLAMLCKASVARRLMDRAYKERWPLEGSVRAVDAKTHFSAAVSAVLLVLRSVEKRDEAPDELAWDVYPSLDAPLPSSRMGIRRGCVCSDVEAHRRTEALEGVSPTRFRSGIKHDLARVMELTQRDGVLENGLGEQVVVEPEHVYPLLKGSDLAHDRAGTERFVLVTQTRLGADTTELEANAPATFRYLDRHRALFAARKSRIYRGQSPFAMFGVGEYTFAPYKVAISGLHKRLAFRLVGPRDGRPVLLDDTSYFLPFREESAARRALSLLATPAAREFFEARLFWDDMRPITKALLDSLSLDALERMLVTA